MPHYSRAPIAEAVIDLHLSFDGEGTPSIGQLGEVADTISDEFTQRQQINSVSMAWSQDGATNASHEAFGLRLNNTKGDRVLQLRRQGLSLSHLQPYTDWAEFSGSLEPIWAKYVSHLRPVAVVRSAVRYINRIEIPAQVNLDDFLNLTPRSLDGLGPFVEGYFLQMVLPQVQIGPEWKVIVNTGIEATHKKESMTVLLDIDAFCTLELPVEQAAVWKVLAQLRDRKNTIFEACITDRVRRLIE